MLLLNILGGARVMACVAALAAAALALAGALAGTLAGDTNTHNSTTMKGNSLILYCSVLMLLLKDFGRCARYGLRCRTCYSGFGVGRCRHQRVRRPFDP